MPDTTQFSYYLDEKLLNHLFGKTSYTAPTIWVGLSTADPGKDAAALAEPDTGDAYGRVETAASDWNAAVTGGANGGWKITNANAVQFEQATDSWGTITFFTLHDAETAGNMLGCAPLTTPKPIGSGDTAIFNAGDIEVDLN